jgi:hypothetical protein
MTEMPAWKISKIISDLIWETLRHELQTKLRKAVENKDLWTDVSERVRLALLAQLNHKKPTHAQPKTIKTKKDCEK